MYDIDINTIIGAHESVYRDSPGGKLEKNRIVETMSLPHHKGFYCNSETGFSIAIDDLITFLTSKDSIIGRMPLTHSTAVGTPFRGMPTIHNLQRNIVVKTSGRKNLPECKKWNSHHGFIEFSAFGFKSFKVFDSNFGIESLGYFDNLFSHLSQISPDEILLTGSEGSEFLFILEGLQQGPSFQDSLASFVDVFSEISLIKDFAIWRNNRNGKMFCINIDPQNIWSIRNFLVFGKISDNLAVGSKTIGLAYPAFRKKSGISFPASIFLDWNRNSLPGVKSKLHKIKRLCFECRGSPWNVAFDGDIFDAISLGLADLPFNITDNLRTKRGGFFAG